DLGRRLADAVGDRLPATAAGDVILGTPRAGVPLLDARALGFQQEMKKIRPKLHVIGPLDTGDRPGTTGTAWRRLIALNHHALAIASVGADGALLAGLRHSSHGSWLAAAFDIDAASLTAVKQGDLVLISPEHFLKGAVAGRLQARSVSGHA